MDADARQGDGRQADQNPQKKHAYHNQAVDSQTQPSYRMDILFERDRTIRPLVSEWIFHGLMFVLTASIYPPLIFPTPLQIFKEVVVDFLRLVTVPQAREDFMCARIEFLYHRPHLVGPRNMLSCHYIAHM